MKHLIDKDAILAEIESLLDKGKYHEEFDCAYRDGNNGALYALKDKLDTLEVKEVDLDYIKNELDEVVRIYKPDGDFGWGTLYNVATHFFELGIKAQHDNWKVVDNINPPQADRNKIYCVLSKNKYLLARVVNHPQDEDLLQWKCTEFPFHRYDMCEGDKYMQIV